jgi:hypothetical protein
MKIVRSIFGGSCPQPPTTVADGHRLMMKICQLYDFLQQNGPDIINRLDGFRIEYSIVASNLADFIQHNNVEVTLNEVSRDCQHSIFIKEVPVTAYIKSLELLIREADQLGICSYRRKVRKDISLTHRNVLSTLLCHIGWEGWFCQDFEN